MPERNSYDHGTPCWIDLMSPDIEASKAFYTGLFGWTAKDEHGPDGEYIYTNFSLKGKVATGMGKQPDEMAGMPPVWNSYVAVDDIDQVLKNVEAAGGQIIMPSMQIMQHGSMAVFADPTGAAISLWQADQMHGSAIVNEPNAYSWNELMTRDLDAAKAFYSEVFGWEYDGMDMGEMGMYHVVKGGTDGMAGMMTMPPEMPAEVPSYWGVYFTVADTDATCAKVTELGGTIVMGPMDSPAGRLATMQDSGGGTFMVMQAPAES